MRKALEHQRLAQVPGYQTLALEWELQRHQLRVPEHRNHQKPVRGQELQRHQLRVLEHQRDHLELVLEFQSHR